MYICSLALGESVSALVDQPGSKMAQGGGSERVEKENTTSRAWIETEGQPTNLQLAGSRSGRGVRSLTKEYYRVGVVSHFHGVVVVKAVGQSQFNWHPLKLEAWGSWVQVWGGSVEIISEIKIKTVLRISTISSMVIRF